MQRKNEKKLFNAFFPYVRKKNCDANITMNDAVTMFSNNGFEVLEPYDKPKNVEPLGISWQFFPKLFREHDEVLKFNWRGRECFSLRKIDNDSKHYWVCPEIYSPSYKKNIKIYRIEGLMHEIRIAQREVNTRYESYHKAMQIMKQKEILNVDV